MKKLNAEVYQRLLVQAEEAKERGLHKLANAITNSLGPLPEDEDVQYSYSELQDDVYSGLWKLANHVIKYHNVNMVDAEQMHDILETLASKLVEDVEESLHIQEVGPLEPKVPGEA